MFIYKKSTAMFVFNLTAVLPSEAIIKLQQTIIKIFKKKLLLHDLEFM